MSLIYIYIYTYDIYYIYKYIHIHIYTYSSFNLNIRKTLSSKLRDDRDYFIKGILMHKSQYNFP